MSADLLHTLVNATLVSSVAVLLIAIVRKPIRAIFGARVAYWLWLLVPVSTFAVLIPAPTPQLRGVVESLPISVAAITDAMTIMDVPQSSIMYVVVGLVLWLVGACLMLALLIRRQSAFVRSLGATTPAIDGVRRSGAIVAPMVVGVWRPQLIVPADFAVRYNDEEQRLMLAHERAHLARHDTSINAVAALWLCCNWFNPLMYWALGLLRLDQELACDAYVLAKLDVARGSYANALLKTQLATESAWRMPIGCYWHTHPLKERVMMLKRSLPGFPRRILGVILVLALTVSSSYTVWAAQDEVQTQGTPIVVRVHLWIWSESGSREITATMMIAAGGRFLLPFDPSSTPVNGQEFQDGLAIECGASLPNEGGQLKMWEDMKARGDTTDGKILLQCKLMQDREVLSRPALIVKDDEAAIIESSVGGIKYKLELIPSISAARVEAARAVRK
ncbi:MAG: M56 family metallopeptidase [Steroidobacteraceae bacterium]